ncbi:MAG: energy-coupling factor ABC transporter permease [Isosphaeraceae bacterium]
MHIPDAILEPPVVAATGVLGAAGLAYCLHRAEKELKDRTTPYMGIMAAFVFAAQMVNFPVGPGVSGHLLGGVLAAVMLGPWAGAVVIGAVLLVQCFLFGDGGLTALGANFLNMGMVGSVLGYAIYEPIRRAIGGQRGILIGAMIAAWFTVLIAAGGCAIEIAAVGDRRNFLRVLSWMALVHAAIGVGEALITGLVVRFVLMTRPDLIAEGKEKTPDAEIEAGAGRTEQPWLRPILAGLGISLAVAVFLAPFASELPDGLEFVGEQTGVLEETSVSDSFPAPLRDYQFPLPGLRQVQVATAAAGLVGTLIVFVASWGLARALAERPLAERGGADAR